MADAHDPQAGIADALAQLSEETRTLVRQEIDAAREEVSKKAQALVPAAGLLGAAGLCGLFATASLYRFVLRVLEKLLPPGLAALVAAGGFGGGAIYSAKLAVERVRRSEPPLPSRTAGQAAEAVRDRTGATAPAAPEGVPTPGSGPGEPVT